MSEKKKKIIISTCLILVLILAVVGISYAAFQFVGQGQQVNQITTGTIQMNYEEGSNVIRLTNALPTTDTTGKVRLVEGEYFDFSVTTNITGDALINWEIAAEDFEDNTFDGKNVKFYLTKIVDGNEVEVSSSLPAVYSEKTSENKKTGRPANMMSLLTGSTNTQGEEITNYRLRLYVDEAYNPQGDGGGRIFKTRINVYGKVNTDPIELPVMRSYVYDDSQSYTYPILHCNDDFHADQYRNEVTSIVIKTDTNIPSTAIAIENGKGTYWDVSQSQDDSVIAYLEDDGDNGYKATIGGDGGVAANPYSSWLFAGFCYLESLDTSNLDTSKVTNMSFMFCDSIRNVNLNLTSFDTSNVTRMDTMFYYSGMSGLDLSSFDTSKVTNMWGMFSRCDNLTSLDLTSFDTSKVTNMSFMFDSSPNLVSIIVSDKWVNMDSTGMFSGCGTDHVTIV